MKVTLAFVLAGLASYASAGPLKPVQAATGPLDIQILQYALTLEHLEAAFYKEGLATYSSEDFSAAGFPLEVRQDLVAAGEHEAIHVTALQSLLGSRATKPCTYQFNITSVQDFTAKAQVLEATGVSAYLGAAPLISKADYLRAAGSILAVEARHEAAVDVALGKPPAPAAFDTPLNFSQVWSLASGFIKSCPKGNPDLPVMPYQRLGVAPAAPQIGDEITLSFKKVKGVRTYYAFFLNGANQSNLMYKAKLDSNNRVTVPRGLSGRVYVVVSKSSTLNDPNTVAGTVFFDI